MNMIVMSAYERHVARSYMKQRNLFHDRLEKVLLLIPNASLSMKEKRARIAFKNCINSIKEASMVMKQKTAKRIFQMNLPILQAVAKIKHTHRFFMHYMILDIHKVGGDKSCQRARLYHVLHAEFPLGIQKRKNYQKDRMHFQRMILSSMMDTVYQRQMYTERIRYANAWEAIMNGILNYRKAEPAMNEKTQTDDMFFAVMVGVLVFWVVVWGLLWNSAYMGYFVVGKFYCSYKNMMNSGNELLKKMEYCYEHNHPPPSRKQKRYEKKMKKKMRLQYNHTRIL